jgi:hypothetical protein
MSRRCWLATLGAAALACGALASPRVDVLPGGVAFSVTQDQADVSWSAPDGSLRQHRLERVSNLYAAGGRVVTPFGVDELDSRVSGAAAHTFASSGGGVVCTLLADSGEVVLLVRDVAAGTLVEIGPVARYGRSLAAGAPSGAYAQVSHHDDGDDDAAAASAGGARAASAASAGACGARFPPPFEPAMRVSSQSSGADGIIELLRAGEGVALSSGEPTWRRLMRGGAAHDSKQAHNNAHNNAHAHDRSLQQDPALLAPYRFGPGCFAGDERQHVVRIAVTSDAGFFRAAGSRLAQVRAEIEFAVACASAIFQGQLNVRLEIAELRLASDAPELPASWPAALYGLGVSTACPRTTGDVLDVARGVNANATGVSVALWHHMTACLSADGTVGMAWVGAMCQGSGYNSAVSMRSPTAWKTFAHEVGHGLGAMHSFEAGKGRTGGIMDYGNGLIAGSSVLGMDGRKRGEVCGTLGAAARQRCDAFQVAAPGPAVRCGDRFLEPATEQCECADGSASCAGCVGCRLANATQQCSAAGFFMNSAGQRKGKARGGYLADAQCCSAAGALAKAGTPCSSGSGGAPGLCSLDQCVNPCAGVGFALCGEPISDGCRAKCQSPSTGVCSAYYWAVDHFAGDLEDGALCVRANGAAGQCTAGVCAAPAPPTAATPRPSATTVSPSSQPSSQPSSPSSRPTTAQPTAQPTVTKRPSAAPTPPPVTPTPTWDTGARYDALLDATMVRACTQGLNCSSSGPALLRFGSASSRWVYNVQAQSNFSFRCAEDSFLGSSRPGLGAECQRKPFKPSWLYATGQKTTPTISVQKASLVRFSGARSGHVFKLVGPATGTFPCSQDFFFGVDPAPGQAKYCWVAPLDGTSRMSAVRSKGKVTFRPVS